MILDLLLINLIVSLVFIAGFWDTLDDIIANKWKFHHLPHYPFMCGLCQCFWLSILYILVTGNFTLWGIVLSLVNGHLTEVTIPLITLIKNGLLRLIKVLGEVIWK